MNFLKPTLFGLSIAAAVSFTLAWFNPALEPYKWFFLLAGLAAFSLAPNNRLVRAAFGVIALAFLVFVGTQLLSKTSIGRKHFDLTKDKRYTLTVGTRAILSELKDPVTINYYVTRNVNGTPPHFERHIPRVDNFLKEIAALSKDDLITLRFIDPRPDTDEEDAARLDQVRQVQVTQNDKMIFGASISSLDKKTVIPFFDPENETQLEFQVLSAIAEVTKRETPVVGLMSSLNMSFGGQAMNNGPWLFYEVLRRQYDLVDLTLANPLSNLESTYSFREWGDAPAYLDPEKIPIILVVHPAGITPQAEFAIDQYLLRGGTVVAFVDGFSVAAYQSQGQRQQIPGMPPQGGIPTDSSLPKIFEKHKVNLTPAKAIIDRKFVDKRDRIPGLLRIEKEGMAAPEDIALSSIKDIALFFPGGFTRNEGDSILMGPGLETTTLVESSYNYAPVNVLDLVGDRTGNAMRFILSQKNQNDQKVAFVTHMAGNFETAFPDGAPSNSPPKPDNSDDENNQSEDTSLKSATERGNLYLFADADIFLDNISFEYNRFFGVIQPRYGNGPFLLNIIDQAVGSKHLIGARARTPHVKAFTTLKDLEADTEKASTDKIEELKAKRSEAEKKIKELASKATKENLAQLSSEAREEQLKFEREFVAANKAIREEQKSHQSKIDSLKAGIFTKTVFYVPVAVILIGLLVFISRKVQTSAR